MQLSDHAWNYHPFMSGKHTHAHSLTQRNTHKIVPGWSGMHKHTVRTVSAHARNESVWRKHVTAVRGNMAQWHGEALEVLIVLPLPYCMCVCFKSLLGCINMYLSVFTINVHFSIQHVQNASENTTNTSNKIAILCFLKFKLKFYIVTKLCL